MQYEVTDVPAATYAVIRRTVPFAEVSNVIPELVGQVLVHLPHEQAAHGRPMCFSSSAGEGMLNIGPGWEIGDGSGDPPGPAELVRTPAQRAAVHLHVGPYVGLAEVYPRFYDALTAAGLKPADEPREIYESEQGDPMPTTRIIWPLTSS